MRGGAGETAGYEGRGWGDCRIVGAGYEERGWGHCSV